MLRSNCNNSATIETVVLVVALVSDLSNFVVSGVYCVDHEKMGWSKTFLRSTQLLSMVIIASVRIAS